MAKYVKISEASLFKLHESLQPILHLASLDSWDAWTHVGGDGVHISAGEMMANMALAVSAAQKSAETVANNVDAIIFQYNRHIPTSTRFFVLQRDGFSCKYCGATAADGAVLHVDHVNPVSNGGTCDPNNLVTSCEQCNLGKSDSLLDEETAEQQEQNT